MPRPKRQKTWLTIRSEIENRLLNSTAELIRTHEHSILGLDFDFENLTLHVRIARHLGLPERQHLRQELQNSIAKEFPAFYPDAVRMNIRTPLQYPYTVHKVPIAKSLVSSGHYSFPRGGTITIREIESLRRLYRHLWKLAHDADRVVTTARGGIPILNYLVECEKTRRGKPLSISRMKAKYHLFPGLAWDIQSLRAKNSLTNWVTHVRSSEKFLFFDTGTQGNGARTLFDVLLAALPRMSNRTGLQLHVIGVVDKKTPDQRRQEITVRGRRGRRSVSIRYMRAKWIPTEDSVALLGYELLADPRRLQPTAVQSYITIEDAEGKPLWSIATRAAPTVFRRIIQASTREAFGIQSSTVAPFTMADLVVTSAYKQEIEEVRAAATAGFINRTTERDLLENCRKRHMAIFEKGRLGPLTKRRSGMKQQNENE